MKQPLHLHLALHIPEVRVLAQGKGLGIGQPFERAVAGNLMVLCETHGSLRNNLTVVLDSEDCVEQTVYFFQVNLDLVNLRVVRD